jgi:hypothetical protein
MTNKNTRATEGLLANLDVFSVNFKVDKYFNFSLER